VRDYDRHSPLRWYGRWDRGATTGQSRIFAAFGKLERIELRRDLEERQTGDGVDTLLTASGDEVLRILDIAEIVVPLSDSPANE
jgi:hypothetical protein